MDIRHYAFGALTAILLLGTLYSMINDTYLDTSNPLLTHLAHPLSKTHYFATKANPLNIYFIKRSWAWTSAVFLFTWFTSPRSVRTKERLVKYLILTGVWILFTSWFFGPALLERAIVYSGGECVALLPSGEQLTVPNEFCYTKSTLTRETHPDLFGTTSFPLTEAEEEWSVIPRLRRGHDVSGHVFLLTMSTLFLADQLRPSYRSNTGPWSTLHIWAIAAQVMLIGIWLFASYTTSIYFHSPFEKLTGYFLGVAGFLVSQIPFLQFPRERVHARRRSTDQHQQSI